MTSRVPLLLAAALALVASPVAARQERPGPEQSVSAYLVVLTSSLNLRAEANLDARVVGAVARGATLCILRYEREWAEVFTPLDPEKPSTPLRGFVSRGFVGERRADRRELEAMGCRSGGETGTQKDSPAAGLRTASGRSPAARFGIG